MYHIWIDTSLYNLCSEVVGCIVLNFIMGETVQPASLPDGLSTTYCIYILYIRALMSLTHLWVSHLTITCCPVPMCRAYFRVLVSVSVS